ncbi:hypothetical protein [Vibrio parahaemolyticus]|uniref:hypothetical protein n=1 Tax=Vibrio parahaemolyticus TaxID=670 RepID=UPI00111E67C5|nr:hypothetical protein [Vibrio parahaemolyticus]TOI60583.1 hypothetical protein CGI55_20370 [Vibrio parahaemolyticus]
MSANKYKNHEVTRVVDVNPHKKVLSVIRKRDRKNAHTLALLFFDWPATNDVIEQLCCFITDGIKSDKEPVIYPILEEALDKYSGVVFHANKRKYEDPVRLGVFLETIITETAKALEIEIEDSLGNKWSVEKGEPFSHWLADHKGELFIVPHQHQNECKLRKALYQLVASESVKTVLRRTNYEEAVVAGRLVASH